MTSRHPHCSFQNNETVAMLVHKINRVKGEMQRNWAWFDFDLKQKIVIKIIVIQSFT